MFISYRGFNGALVLVAALLIISLFIALIIKGGFWLSSILYPVLNIISIASLLLCFLVLLPLSILQKDKTNLIKGFYITSYIFGATTWTLSFVLAYTIWGLLGLVVGLFLFGVGVVPVAILATLFTGEWTMFLRLIILVLITYLTREYAKKISKRERRGASSKSNYKTPSIEGDIEYAEYEEIED